MKTKYWKILAFAMVALMVFSVFAGCQQGQTTDNSAAPEETATAPEETVAQTQEPTETAADTSSELPRNETLYFAGQQWGSVNGWNPLSDDMNNAMAIAQSAGGSRTSCLKRFICTTCSTAP